MRISLNWLADYVDIPVGVDELAKILTMLGLEIEAIERPGAEIENVFVGQILSIEPHPDADKLVVCKTDIGKPEPLQIVCGAKNMKVGDKVPTAVIGAKLAGGFEIGRRKMRGIESQGMMCSADELGLGADHSGLLILDPATPIGADAKPILGLDDVVMEIEVTPNRGDWACMLGVARELAGYFNTPMRVPAIVLTESGAPAAKLSSVTIENDELCPRYAGRVLTGAQIAPSPQWMCSRLLAAGQRPINNVVDVTNYVMLETGHPLHAFDYDLLRERRIVVRNPRHGEQIKTIDGQMRNLDPEMLIIADAELPVAVAGVMGGAESEVGETTTNIFLEGAWFKPASVRKTARTLGMQSEASAHFQRGADIDMALYAVNRAAMLMQQLAGATIAPGVLDEYPRKTTPKTITLRAARADLLLGTKTSAAEQCDTLRRLGFEITASSDEACTVRVPTWRHDVSQEADLIEEVARFHGYDKIAVTLPAVQPSEQIFAPGDAKIRGLRRFLVGEGLTEFFNWTFSSPQEVADCALDAGKQNMVVLQNPLSERQATMRSSLIPGLLANVSRNVRHGSANVAAFEVGPVFVPVDGRDLPDEPVRVGVVLSGFAGEKHWSGPQAPLDFYDLKGYCEAIFEFFGAPCTFEEKDYGTFQEGQCGAILCGGAQVGLLGQVRDGILKTYDVEQPVFLCEIDLAPLLAAVAPAPQFAEIAAFPPSRRDMAVTVDCGVAAGALRAAAIDAGGKLLKSVDIFDVYTGKQIGEGKKSVALSLVFQSDERTLTDRDTQKSWDRILKKLQTEFGAELR
jgi:phenylalanyl-tRNA synthetase beta chain